MTDNKKADELDEAELDQVTGGGADSHDAYANLEVSHIKSGLTEAQGKGKTVGIRKVVKGGKESIVSMDEGETI